ncbi:hypothetical protein ID875_10185 [Streptomyces globisporus]|uniref:PH domain-containing protein n=1 Tax=Streptomyces globisporus TaxID=1908 RepID=A0A927BKY1_STRGL|nr:hypothetical protein [Streptomyces globisporus]
MEWLLRLWTLSVALWIFARLGAWRVTADRDGVAVPRLFTVERLPWDEVGKAVARRDGCVHVGSRITGPFLPAPLARLLRRPDGARAMADHLTIMVRNPELRPTERADARTRVRPYAVWAPLPSPSSPPPTCWRGEHGGRRDEPGAPAGFTMPPFPRGPRHARPTAPLPYARTHDD